MKQVVKKAALAIAMFAVLSVGVSVYSAPSDASVSSVYPYCPYGPNIVVGRNYFDGSGNIVGVWRCDCNGPRLLSGVYTSTYTQYPNGFCAF